MPITVSGTEITFNDATTQSTAAVAGGGFSGLQVFNSPGTFATPANTSKIYAVACSGGGGGGGAASSPRPALAGGSGFIGAGVYPVTGGSPLAVTVGAGGNGGPATTNAASPGNAGGATSVGDLLTCNGGNAGNASPANASGTTGNSGTAPLATTGAASVGAVPGTVFSNTAGAGAPQGPPGSTPGNGQPGANGTAGKVLIYF